MRHYHQPAGTTDVTDKYEALARRMGVDVVRVANPIFGMTAHPGDADKWPEDTTVLIKEGRAEARRRRDWEVASAELEQWDRDYRMYLYEVYEITDVRAYVDEIRFRNGGDGNMSICPSALLTVRYGTADVTIAEFNAQQKQWAELDHWDLSKNLNAPIPHPKTERRMKDTGQANTYFDMVALIKRMKANQSAR